MQTYFVSVRPAFGLFVLLAALSQAQTIAPDQTTLSFAAPVGGSAVAQDLRVTSSGAPLTLTAVANTYNGTGNWLAVSPTTSSTSLNPTFKVSVNVGGLQQAVYGGAITVTAPATGGAITVNVTLTVGTPSTGNPTTLVATPNTLSFSGQAGGLVPNAQLLNIASAPPGVTFTTSASTNDAFNWLQVPNPNSTAPTALTVYVNTAGMPVGTYTGTVTLTPSTGGVLAVPVSLTLSSSTPLAASVSSLQFYYQIGSFLPVQQFFSLSSGGSPLNVAVSPSTNDGTAWLSASPLFTTTPQTITVNATPGNLPAGTYTGKIHVSAPSASNQVIDISVTLTISGGPLLTVGVSPGTFVYQPGMQAPPAQTIPISTTTGTLNYSVTTSTTDGSNWLVVSPLQGQTPQNLSISVSPGSLAPGNYTGVVTVSSSGAANSPLHIPVSLSVNGASSLVVSSQSLTLNYETAGQNNVQSQPLYVSSTGQPVTFTASTTTTSCGANWLQVFPTTATTTAALTVAIQPLGFNLPETCTGTVVLTPQGGGSLQIPVTLNVTTTTPLFNVSPLSLLFSAAFDSGSPSSQNINLSVTDNSAVPFTAVASTSTGGATWLQVAQTSTNTPAVLTVTANPANLSVGTYTGSITVNSSALPAGQLIPVTFKVTAASNAVVSPTSLAFIQGAGGPAPQVQNVSVTANGPGLSYSVTTSTNDLGQWLFVTPVTGTTPGTVAVSVNGSSLRVGTYTGSVTLTLPGAGNSPYQIPITLTITAAQTINVAPGSLTFTYPQGSTSPLTQQINVTSPSTALSVTATVGAGASWLSVTPASGNTPASFTIAAAPGSLAPGGYDGIVILTPAGGTAFNLPVHLDVITALTPSVLAISNAASGVRGVVSPGEIVTLTGNTLGPVAGAGLQLLADGTLATTVAGTQVFFDDVAAPILYTSAGQINTIVPYEVATHPTVQVVVAYQGIRTQGFTIQTGASAPGIFTATQNGRGQGAILNQDNSVNSASAPEIRGRIVQVYATGEGLINPAAITGGVTQTPGTPIAKVTATVGGAPAEVDFAGPAPQAVAGLLQVNVRIPQSAPSGDVPITITVGTASSQPGVTVAIR